MLQIAALAELVLCWIFWVSAFVGPNKQAAGHKKVASAPSAKMGVFLVMVSFAMVWTYVPPAALIKTTPYLIVSMVTGPASAALAWAAARELGKQWRLEAAISDDHELVTTGPYRWVRHPIYASMLGMLVATAAAIWTTWPMFVGAVAVFVVGTEIRSRAEERLLAEHFPTTYPAYRKRAWAYIPFIR